MPVSSSLPVASVGEVVAEQTAHAVIGFSEHLDHDVHTVVIGAGEHLRDGSLEQILVTITVSGESACDLLTRPGELVTSRFANGVEPFDEFGLLDLEKRLIVITPRMRLQILDRDMALGVAPRLRRLHQAAEGILETADIDVGRIQTVQETTELVEEVVIERSEQI